MRTRISRSEADGSLGGVGGGTCGMTWACDRRVVELQAKDPQTIGLWTKLVNASRVYFEKIYAKLEVSSWKGGRGAAAW